MPIIKRFPTGLIIPEKPDPRTLLAPNYTDLNTGYYPKVIQWAKTVPVAAGPRPWSPKGNDKWSDCTEAARGNITKVQTWNNGNYYDPTDAECLAAWTRITGWDPATQPPPGPGVSSIAMLNDAIRNPFGKTHRTTGYMFVPILTQDSSVVRRALYRYGPLYWELMCPDSMFAQVKKLNTPFSIFSDPVLSLPKWGHAMIISGADDGGLGVQTWGYSKRCMWDFFFRYGVGLYAVFTSDWKPLGRFDKVGFNRDQKARMAA